MNYHNTINRKIILWTILLGELFQFAGQRSNGVRTTGGMKIAVVCC